MAPFFFFICLCKPPSSYKSIIHYFHVFLRLFSMIGKLGSRAWKLTILIRFYTGSYTIFLWVANSDFLIPLQSAPSPQIIIFYIFYWIDFLTMFDPIMQRYFYDFCTGTSLIQVEKYIAFYVFWTLIYIYIYIYMIAFSNTLYIKSLIGQSCFCAWRCSCCFLCSYV